MVKFYFSKAPTSVSATGLYLNGTFPWVHAGEPDDASLSSRVSAVVGNQTVWNWIIGVSAAGIGVWVLFGMRKKKG